MNLEQYQRYVAAFNNRDYDTLHAFFAEDVVLETLGYEIQGKAGIRRFYDFFHDHVRETVTLRHYVAGAGIDFADVVIRFEGLKDLTPQRLALEGYPKMTPVPQGGVAEVAFFIAYHSGPDGRISRIRCAVLEPVAAPA